LDYFSMCFKLTSKIHYWLDNQYLNFVWHYTKIYKYSQECEESALFSTSY
jgi:hypothetical protein